MSKSIVNFDNSSPAQEKKNSMIRTRVLKIKETFFLAQTKFSEQKITKN